MKDQLELEHPELPIALLGVNEYGHEAGNTLVTTGRDIPWLQDTEETDWWTIWDPTYRDVIILDGQGELVAVFNLTEKPITENENYFELYDLLVSLAQ
jgi:hypothetical protein